MRGFNLAPKQWLYGGASLAETNTTRALRTSFTGANETEAVATDRSEQDTTKTI